MSDSKAVKDLMIGISEYPHVLPSSPLSQAIKKAKALCARDSKYCEPLAILVVDGKNQLLGTLTLRDILRGLEPRFLKPTTKAQVPEEDEAALSVIWDSLFDRESRDLAERPVSEIMVPAQYFVGPDDRITKAAYLMLHHDLIMLPVLENKKKFVGLVRMIEIFDAISDAIFKK
jgi:CBS domain-containing protein